MQLEVDSTDGSKHATYQFVVWAGCVGRCLAILLCWEQRCGDEYQVMRLKCQFFRYATIVAVLVMLQRIFREGIFSFS